MPLKLYLRGDVWHYRGTVAGRRLRGSTGVSRQNRETAQRVIAELEARAWKGRIDPGSVLTFAQAANLYIASGKPTRFVGKVLDHWKNTPVKDISGGRIREALAWAEREALHRRNASLRFDRHQRLAASLPGCPEVRALRKAMLDTAWRLLDETRCEEADAILEFLPPDQARALLDEYFYEDDDAPNPTPSPVSEGSVEARGDGSPPTPSEGGPVGVDLREADEGVAPHPDQIR